MAIKYETLVERIVYDANDNATYYWVELSPAHVPSVTGLIKRISFAGATNSGSGITEDPVYLGVWERQDDGGLAALGVSKAPIVQQLNADNVWEFDGITCRGRSLLISLLSNPKEHWNSNTSLLMRSRVKTGDSDGCVMLALRDITIGRQNVTPDITFVVEYAVEVPDEPEEPDTPNVPDEPVIPDEPEEEEVNLRQIDILDYLPPVVHNTDEFKQIAEAENPELNNFMRCTYDVLINAFIQNAKPYVLDRWENILNLSHNSDDSFDDRRIRIVTHLTLNVPYTWRVLKQMLNEFLGEGNFTLDYINDESKLVIRTNLLTGDKLQTVDELLDKVVPRNIDIVKYNYFPLPSEYKLVEYLEGNNEPWLLTHYYPTSETRAEIEMLAFGFPSQPKGLLGNESGVAMFRFFYSGASRNVSLFDYNTKRYEIEEVPRDTRFKITLSNGLVLYDEREIVTFEDSANWEATSPLCLFISSADYAHKAEMRMFSATFYEGEKLTAKFVPCLNELLEPGLFELISRQFYTNAGTGHFSYPGKEQEASTFSLRRPVMYGKITPYGVRRLYHVPKGYNGTKEEYAAEHGFKPIVETPMPEEGYWVPQWRETEEEIVLEWVETEPPVDEELKEEVNEND